MSAFILLWSLALANRRNFKKSRLVLKVSVEKKTGNLVTIMQVFFFSTVFIILLTNVIVNFACFILRTCLFKRLQTQKHFKVELLCRWPHLYYEFYIMIVCTIMVAKNWRWKVYYYWSSILLLLWILTLFHGIIISLRRSDISILYNLVSWGEWKNTESINTFEFLYYKD